jgi:hypothetical protein
LNAAVVLVMYGDYECSQSTGIYRLIKVIERQLGVSLGNDVEFHLLYTGHFVLE